MAFRYGVYSARAMHVHYAFPEALSVSGNLELATRYLTNGHRSTSAIRWCMSWGVVVHCARATHVHTRDPLISGNFELGSWELVHRSSFMSLIRWWMTQGEWVHRARTHVQTDKAPL